MEKDCIRNAGTTDSFRLFVQTVAERSCMMDKMEPGWNHYDLKHLRWLLYYYHEDFEDTLNTLISNKDWQGLNNYFYQHNRLDTFPTYIYVYDPPAGIVFYYALTAIAVGDDKIVEHLFPADRTLKHYIEELKGSYPLHRVGELLLAGIWYQDSILLDYAVPKAEKFVGGKRPKWEIATISYLLALQEHDVAKASEHLENACKVLHTDLTDIDKKIFVSAHGLYRLAARVLDEEEFQKLSMPKYKTFCKEYAKWCNSNTEPPQLCTPFPESVSFLNDLLTADWRNIPWELEEEFYPLPAEWIEADRQFAESLRKSGKLQ